MSEWTSATDGSRVECRIGLAEMESSKGADGRVLRKNRSEIGSTDQGPKIDPTPTSSRLINNKLKDQLQLKEAIEGLQESNGSASGAGRCLIATTTIAAAAIAPTAAAPPRRNITSELPESPVPSW